MCRQNWLAFRAPYAGRLMEVDDGRDMQIQGLGPDQDFDSELECKPGLQGLKFERESSRPNPS